MAIGKSIAQRDPTLRFIRWAGVSLVLWYLKTCARLALVQSSATIIGIAGSVGKSTTRNAIAALVSPHKKTLTVTGNSETGVPLGILSLDIGNYRFTDWLRVLLLAPTRIFSLRTIEVIIVELGIDGPLPPKNMTYLTNIITPHVAILTHEAPAHVGNYETVFRPQRYPARYEDLEPIMSFITHDDARIAHHKNVAMVFFPANDPLLTEATADIPQHKKLTVSFEADAAVRITQWQVTAKETTFSFTVHAYGLHEKLHVTFPFVAIPKDSGVSLGFALLAAAHVGVPLTDAADRLQHQLSFPPGRATSFSGANDTWIIDSTYNATPASIRAFLDLLRELKKENRRLPTVGVFGDMKELGSFAPLLHSALVADMVDACDHIILVGPLMKEFVLPKLEQKSKSLKSLQWFPTAIEAGKHLEQHIPPGAVVLCKGSQLLEEAIKFVIPKKAYPRLCRQNAFWKASKQKLGVWKE